MDMHITHCVYAKVMCNSILVQCHSAIYSQLQLHLQSSRAPVAISEQWPLIRSHHGIRECFLWVSVRVCMCDCVHELWGTQWTHHKGERMQRKKIALYSCLCLCMFARVAFHFPGWQLKYHSAPVSQAWPFLSSLLLSSARPRPSSPSVLSRLNSTMAQKFCTPLGC